MAFKSRKVMKPLAINPKGFSNHQRHVDVFLRYIIITNKNVFEHGTLILVVIEGLAVPLL